MSHAKLLCLFAGVAMTNTVFANTNTVNRDEVRAVVAEMMADSESRTSLLQGGGNAGYDKKFFVSSADNKFRLNFSGYLKVRYTLNIRDEDGVPGTLGGVGNGGAPDTSFTSNFSMRDIAVQFDGHVVSPDLTFAVRIRGNNGNSAAFDDAYVAYNLGDGWYVKGGQFKLAFSREQLISDTMGTGAERSINDAFFSAGRTQGVELGYKNDEWMFAFGFNDGFNSSGSGTFANNNYNVAPAVLNPNPGPGGNIGQVNNLFPLAGPSAYSIGARADWTFAGSRDQLKDVTSKPTDKMAAAVGAAVNWESGRRGIASNTANNRYKDALNWTVDAQFEDSGWSALAALHGSFLRTTQPGAGNAPSNFDRVNSHNLGLMVQGAYRWSEESEVFVRYDGLFLARRLAEQAFGVPAAPAVNDLRAKNYNFVTFGYTHYFAGHSAKLVVDCVLNLNNTANFSGSQTAALTNVFLNGTTSNNLGVVGTSKGIEAAIRAQFQLMF